MSCWHMPRQQALDALPNISVLLMLYKQKVLDLNSVMETGPVNAAQ